MIIAEIGWNFLGDLKLAKKMILAAKKSGSSLIKFQLWDPKDLKPGPWDHDGRRTIYEKSYLSEKKFKILYNFGKKNKVRIFASVFNLKSLKILKKIDKNYIKIPSSEAYNHMLIKEALKNFKNVFVSTGALSIKELKSLHIYNKNKKFIPLHCVSSYPLKLSNANFEKFFMLQKKFKKVGYSGHYQGIDDAIFAISQNASVVEKHFTINNNLAGRDNKFALLPNDLKFLNQYFLNHKKMLKKNIKGVLNCERDVVRSYRGRWGT
tara:strand:+ start:4479 stop:5273 length:795 start_codon:yes stop_codon:yes gene_type:complete